PDCPTTATTSPRATSREHPLRTSIVVPETVKLRRRSCRRSRGPGGTSGSSKAKRSSTGSLLRRPEVRLPVLLGFGEGRHVELLDQRNRVHHPVAEAQPGEHLDVLPVGDAQRDLADLGRPVLGDEEDLALVHRPPYRRQ